jgi:hypothetical protein
LLTTDVLLSSGLVVVGGGRVVWGCGGGEGGGGGASGKNSRYFHTLGYENIFLQKSDFLHTQKRLFHTLKNDFIPSKK